MCARMIERTGEAGVMARYMEALTVERGGFRIKVPESWWDFDVRPDSRDDSIRRMVNERVRQPGPGALP